MQQLPPLPDAVATFRLLLTISQHMRYLFDRRLEADNLSTAKAMLLSVVDAIDHLPSYSEIASMTATTHQNVARLVNTLERQGFVTVTADPTDRRVKRVAVTDRSRTYWSERDASDFAFVETMFDSLNDYELSELRRLAERLQEGLKQVYLRDNPPTRDSMTEGEKKAGPSPGQSPGDPGDRPGRAAR